MQCSVACNARVDLSGGKKARARNAHAIAFTQKVNARAPAAFHHMSRANRANCACAHPSIMRVRLHGQSPPPALATLPHPPTFGSIIVQMKSRCIHLLLLAARHRATPAGVMCHQLQTNCRRTVARQRRCCPCAHTCFMHRAAQPLHRTPFEHHPFLARCPMRHGLPAAPLPAPAHPSPPRKTSTALEQTRTKLCAGATAP